MSLSVIDTHRLTVAYGSRVALRDLDLSIGPGITALLGPNGAGKSTLLHVLTGMRPTSGSVSVAGHRLVSRADRRAASALIGYLPQRFDLAGNLRVISTVRYAAWCRGLDRRACPTAAERALEITELIAKRSDRVRTLSGGERQRLGLACALAHQPQVLLLDEPTVGLDPDQRVRFRGYLTSIADEACVVLATHLLDDVRLIGGRLIVLSSGHKAFEGTPGQLQALARPDDTAASDEMESGYREALRLAESPPE